jgi:hypothetical protein
MQSGQTIEREYYFGPRASDRRKKPLLELSPLEQSRRAWTVEDVHDVHHQIKRRLFLGQKTKRIAEDLGVSDVMVRTVANSPAIKEELALMHAAADKQAVDIGQQIAELAPVAIQNIESILRDGEINGKDASAALIMRESNGILDRHLGKAIQRTENRNASVIFDAAKIAEMRARVRQSEKAQQG